jgi:hypothetical protein
MGDETPYERASDERKTTVVVAGSRGFDNFIPLLDDYTRAEYVCACMNEAEFHPDAILSGTASGVDTAGEHFAEAAGLELIQMRAEWACYGPTAGIIRNEHMACAADKALILWDGESNGTEHMIEACNRRLDSSDIHIKMYKDDPEPYVIR